MQKLNKQAIRLFCFLMRKTLMPTFNFPGGRLASDKVDTCLKSLTNEYGEVGLERLVDFCICQVYTIHNYGVDYIPKWKLSHSLGDRALERFTTRKQGQKFFEDRWLKEYGLSRHLLCEYIEDRSEHPYFKFINPQYEEVTKRRLLSSELGYYICGISTLMWTPFSPSCTACENAEKCEIRTQKLYPEIYRIRVAEHRKEAEL